MRVTRARYRAFIGQFLENQPSSSILETSPGLAPLLVPWPAVVSTTPIIGLNVIDHTTETSLARLVPELVVAARERARVLICALQDSPNTPIDVARERAAASVQQYCERVMDELAPTVDTASPETVVLFKQRYTELALEFAKSVRDLEPDAARRHAVAQALQYKILESERRLRSLLDRVKSPAECSDAP